jgi:hypothetical protein
MNLEPWIPDFGFPDVAVVQLRRSVAGFDAIQFCRLID